MTVTTAPTTTQLLPTGTWTIDPVHSSIGFSVRHLMISKVKGTFKTFSGTSPSPRTPSRPRVNVTIDPDSIDTGDANRDNHLRSGDFFEVEKHPKAKYVSTGVRPGRRLRGRGAAHPQRRHPAR